MVSHFTSASVTAPVRQRSRHVESKWCVTLLVIVSGRIVSISIFLVQGSTPRLVARGCFEGGGVIVD